MRKPLSYIFPVTGVVSAVYKETKQYKETHAKAGQSFIIYRTLITIAEDVPQIWIESFGLENRPLNLKTKKPLEEGDKVENFPVKVHASGYQRQSDGKMFGEIKLTPAAQDPHFDDSDDSNLGERL